MLINSQQMKRKF